MNLENLTVGPVASKDAIEFVSKYHYSHQASSGSFRYGLYRESTLVGVSIYNSGTPQMQRAVFDDPYYNQVLHHHRLALLPELPKNTASSFIAECNKRLHKDSSETKAVVTFADLCLGHTGSVYRATNALFTGVTTVGTLKFITPDLRLKVPESIPGSWPEKREYAAARMWYEIKCQGKLRFIYLLGSKSARRVSLRDLKHEVQELPDLSELRGQLEFLRKNPHVY